VEALGDTAPLEGVPPHHVPSGQGGGVDEDRRLQLIAPTIQALSDRLGGHVVALLSIDEVTSAATALAVHDPDPEGHELLSHLLGASIPLAGTVCGSVHASAVALELGEGVEPAIAEEMLPEGWLRYAIRHGVRSAALVPVVHDRVVIALLVVARRVPGRFPGELLDALAESAQRVGRLLPAPPGSEAAPPAARSVRRARSHSLDLIIDLALGLAPASVLLAAAGTVSEPNLLRPAAVLVLCATALGLLRSRVAAAACSLTGLLALWWAFTEPYNSLRLRDVGSATSVVMVALTLVGVQVLLERVHQARRREHHERAVVEALVERLPLGFALLDRNKRFVRVNPKLAALDGVAVDEHLGRRPGDVNPLTGELYEHLIDQVLTEGTAVEDRVVGFELPDAGTTHSWRINHYPIHVGDELAGVGTTIEDITEEMVVRRRAQLMLRLSRTVAAARTLESIADQVTMVLADGLKARSVFVIDEDGWLCAAAVHGYHLAEATEAWQAYRAPLARGGDAATCLDASELVISMLDPGSSRPSRSAEEALHRSVDDVTVVWQPVTRPGGDRATAAIGVAWPYPRRLTEHSRTLLATAASVTGLALDRIALTERTERDRFRTAMDAMIDQVILARSVRDVNGTIVDFEVEFANATALETTGRQPRELVGRRVSELYPRWQSSGMLDQFARVVESGEPWVVDRLHYQDQAADGREVRGYWNLQVVKVGDGYIAASRDVTQMVEAENLAQQAREVARRERIAVDLLQSAALPRSMPELDGVSLVAHYQPARRQQPVGGDWYDAFELGDGVLALVIADVAGDGPEAASTMVQVRNILRAVAAEHEDPGQVLTRVDEVLHRVSDLDVAFVTCCYATLDVSTGCLRWASAGHLPPIVVRADGTVATLVQQPGPPLASLPGRRFKVARAVLGSGDRVLLYTDGLVERRGEVIDTGLARLVDQLERGPDSDCERLVQYLVELLEDPSDDTAILCAAVSAPSCGPASTLPEAQRASLGEAAGPKRR
jgi:PAS domain S-box-containing protein